MKKNNRAVTLLEVIVTISIVFALAVIMIPAINTVKVHGKQSKTMAEINQLDTALMAYFADNGYFPKPGIQAMVSGLKDNEYFSFDQSRLEGNKYKDTWGKSYLYICPGIISGKGYDLYSVGLLLSQGALTTLGNIWKGFSGASSSRDTDDEDESVDTLPIDVVIGDPTGVDKKTIWGLPKPSYDILVKAALKLLRSTNVGFDLAAKINVAHIPIGWADLLSYGAIALYDTESHWILMDYWVTEGPTEATAAVLAHEATHLSDHLANGDQYFDSIQEEYDAFYNETMVWKELKEERPNYVETFLSMELDYAQEVIEAGEETAKDILRNVYGYYYLPEDEEYGDGYVVPKKI